MDFNHFQTTQRLLLKQALVSHPLQSDTYAHEHALNTHTFKEPVDRIWMQKHLTSILSLTYTV